MLLQETFRNFEAVALLDVVRDGEEALQYLRRQGRYCRKHRPGLVLLDINMPKKNGFEVLAEIKAEPKLQSIPVVILTTSRREEDVVASYQGGACSFVSKPIDFSRFEEVAAQFLAGN